MIEVHRLRNIEGDNDEESDKAGKNEMGKSHIT